MSNLPKSPEAPIEGNENLNVNKNVRDSQNSIFDTPSMNTVKSVDRLHESGSKQRHGNKGETGEFFTRRNRRLLHNIFSLERAQK